jgi:hypothetical protein
VIFLEGLKANVFPENIARWLAMNLEGNALCPWWLRRDNHQAPESREQGKERVIFS